MSEETLDMISSLREGESESPPVETPSEEPAQRPAEQAPSEPIEEVTDQDEEAILKEAEERRNAMLREIAMDPVSTQAYVQQQQQPYYPPQEQYYQPQYYQAEQPLQEPEYQLPFDEFSFDPSNPEHQAALVAAEIQKQGQPLFEQLQAITERFKQEEQVKQQQQIQEIVTQANNKTVEFLDTYVPGFSNIAEKLSTGKELTVIEEAVFNMAVNMESPYLQGDPSAVYDIKRRAQIAQTIGPVLQQKAKALGMTYQPKAKLSPEQQQQIKRDLHVESSNAVPAATGTSFDKAVETGNTLGMITALRGK